MSKMNVKLFLSVLAVTMSVFLFGVGVWLHDIQQIASKLNVSHDEGCPA